MWSAGFLEHYRIPRKSPRIPAPVAGAENSFSPTCHAAPCYRGREQLRRHLETFADRCTHCDFHSGDSYCFRLRGQCWARMSEDGEVPASPVTRRRTDARGRRRGRYPSSDSDSEEDVERTPNSDEASGEEEQDVPAVAAPDDLGPTMDEDALDDLLKETKRADTREVTLRVHRSARDVTKLALREHEIILAYKDKLADWGPEGSDRQAARVLDAKGSLVEEFLVPSVSDYTADEEDIAGWLKDDEDPREQARSLAISVIQHRRCLAQLAHVYAKVATMYMTARGAAMAGAELQDALGGLHWDTLQFHGQHDLAIAEMRRRVFTPRDLFTSLEGICLSSTS